ncbi:MAG: hypothetical protein IKU43_04785 [Clostridia bacterium]|nr:hypothetical protein [Clostridia bacterium]
MNKNEYEARLAENLAYLAKRLAVLSALILIFALLSKYIPRSATYEYKIGKESVQSSEITLLPQSASLCTLRLCGNTLGIYSHSGMLEYTAEIDADILTDYDRRLLSEGICASYDELSVLIDELLS